MRRTSSSEVEERTFVTLRLLGGVDVHVLRAGVLADDHPFVDLDAGPDEQRTAILKVHQRVGGRQTAPVGYQRAGGARPQLAVPWLEAVEDVVQHSSPPGLGQELRAETDQAAGGTE